MRIPVFLLLLSGCSWLEDTPETPDEPTPVAAVPDTPTALHGCRGDLNGELLRIHNPATGAGIAVPNADDWQSDCSRTVDPDGSAQLISLSSESLRSSAYMLSLSAPSSADAETALETALTEMREVWEMSGSVDVDHPLPSRPVAVLQATDADSGEVTWQVVTVSQSSEGEWTRIHQTWSCGDCGLDAMGTKSVIDAMVAASSDWGF